MIIAGIGVGLMIGALILAPVMAIGTSKWWHCRRHTDGLYVFSCDHCLKIWRDRD